MPQVPAHHDHAAEHEHSAEQLVRYSGLKAIRLLQARGHSLRSTSAGRVRAARSVCVPTAS
ncbi:MAG TPA: hypothetical protein VFO94_07085, partial [Gammaproteobacteria bacterium]|nr:hypothetical protein [Gammaproteobacteria bacterium]